MIHRSMQVTIVSLLLGSASIAHAQVTKVEVTPSPATLKQPATVTVTGGSAPCGAVEINYGDGTTITYPITRLPVERSHLWSTIGNKPVVATGQGNCTGQATVMVLVSPPKLGGHKRAVANTSPPPTFSVGVASDQSGSKAPAVKTQPTERQQREHLQKLQARLQATAVEWERTAMKRFEEDRRAFLEKRAATLASENAKVRAQIERLRREGR